MGTEWIVFGAAVLISAALTAYMMTQKPSIKGQNMKPATLDAFAVTYCDEGTACPLIYGTVRVPGNLLWYGNLRTTVSHANGPGKPIEGYHYYLDVHQGIGIGLLEIVGLFCGDKACAFTNSYTYTPGDTSPWGITRTLTEDTRSQTIVYNPGDSQYVPAGPGPKASAMNPVCHVLLSQWRMPMNQTYLPTLHFVVKHRFPSWFPITNAEMSNGDNPAAVIYDILLKAGETLFDLASFQTAANYWYSKGYGINISFNEQLEAMELIQTVFNYVDGVLRQQADGTWELIAYTDTDVAEAELDTEDFVEFGISRQSWDAVPNFFVANFQDEANGFSRRTVRLPNSASIAMLGFRITKTIDLTAFRDNTTASARLWELAKRLSYPPLRIPFKTDLRFHNLKVGSVVGITNSNYSIASADFRVVARTIEELDKNLISFEAEQLLSTLFDNSFQIGGSSEQTVPDYSPDPLIYQKAFELPFITAYGNLNPAYLALGARAGTEELFNVYISYDGGVGYEFFKAVSAWSMRGILNHDYDSTHTTQDDPTAIDLNFYREDPVFSTLSDAAFPYTERFALIGTELLRFKSVNPGDGANDLLLTTIERGCYNTPVEDHYQGDEIWLFNLLDSLVLEGISAGSFQLKFVPVSGGAEADISACAAISVTAQYKAAGHSVSASLSPSASSSA